MAADPELVARVLPTPFYSSFIGRASAGDTSDADPGRRAAAWAHWAVVGLADMRGLSERQYVALLLSGKFYDPRGTGPAVPPHLEIPGRWLEQQDSEFPDRLAQMGNALNYPLWVMPEVTAVRRALFGVRPSAPRAELAPLLTVLDDHRNALRESVTSLSAQAKPHWPAIERTLATAPGDLVDVACGNFTAEDVVEFFPAAASLELVVSYDHKLRETSKQWAARRVGVWTITGASTAVGELRLGVLTPRLTANSLFGDPAFVPDRESSAALLVRGLLLRRLLNEHIGLGSTESVAAADVVKISGGPHLRAVVAKYGHKLPEASPNAAALFLQTYPAPDTAWDALTSWCTRHGYIPTVSRETFERAHADALRSLQRAEDVDRAAVDTLLPLAWDDEARVVRLTFARGRKS